MCPFREECRFYNESKSEGLTAHEHLLMREIFCDSELFMLNKDCKIFHSLNHQAPLHFAQEFPGQGHVCA